jgi:hypothetical protein
MPAIKTRQAGTAAATIIGARKESLVHRQLNSAD